MTALKDRLRQLIATAGPIPVSDYMAACLFDPEAGYYTTREPFGTAGDFTTAPEISQMFGELVAVWAYSAWTSLGRPMPMTLAEIGPGRGTLMADMLRTLDRLDTGFVTRARVALIETSSRLTDVQYARLASGRGRPTWFSRVSELPALPLVIVGNELFDAIPVRQFVRTKQGWHERMVGVGDDGALCFVAGMTGIDAGLLPPDAGNAPEGAIFEIAPAREALMAEISARIARDGGAALFIDYGHLRTGLGDTLQAVRAHAYDDVLAHPGEADLTSHVDFFALARIATAHGLEARMTTQGEFLLGLGILERAGTLGAQAGETTRNRLRGEVERLAGPEAMGQLFKVLCVTRKGMILPPFAAKD
jgi:SAM-dependent MidA family methyltransferase